MVLKTDEFSRGLRSEGLDKGYRKLGGSEGRGWKAIRGSSRDGMEALLGAWKHEDEHPHAEGGYAFASPVV